MEYKKTIEILMGLLNRNSLDKEEKEAVLTAIGILDLASLAKKRIKSNLIARKAKRDKDIEWK